MILSVLFVVVIFVGADWFGFRDPLRGFGRCHTAIIRRGSAHLEAVKVLQCLWVEVQHIVAELGAQLVRAVVRLLFLLGRETGFCPAGRQAARVNNDSWALPAVVF